jgi:predicted nucleotidyltransferase
MRHLVDVTAPDPGGVRSRVTTHRDEVLEIAARHGASNLRVFGSIARGDHTEGSDVDLLVDLAPGVTLFTLARLRRGLSALLGVSVDIISAKALLPRDRDVLEEAVGL